MELWKCPLLGYSYSLVSKTRNLTLSQYLILSTPSYLPRNSMLPRNSLVSMSRIGIWTSPLVWSVDTSQYHLRMAACFLLMHGIYTSPSTVASLNYLKYYLSTTTRPPANLLHHLHRLRELQNCMWLHLAIPFWHAQNTIQPSNSRIYDRMHGSILNHRSNNPLHLK